MVEFLYNIDLLIFKFINGSLSNGVFDQLVPWFRDKYFWIPLYVFLIVLCITLFKKYAYIILITAVTTVLISDQLSSSIIKPTVERTRPCNLEAIQDSVHVLAPCRQSYSFTSSHATNHFAVASFFFCILGSFSNKWKYGLLLWAGLVSFAQIYVGLHYPFDVFCGGLLGSFIGVVLSTILLKYIPILPTEDTQNWK